MNELSSELLQNLATDSQARLHVMDQVLSSADAGKVFSQPVNSGGYTVITACEVASGGGFGSGMGLTPARPAKMVASEESGGNEGNSAPEQAGGGGGGGGGSAGRPVAAIVISADGVQVKPILDLTKISLAALTAFGGMGVLALKLMRKR